MNCGVVTLFPEMFLALTRFGVVGRAAERGLLKIDYWNPRDFAENKHKSVDDRPYGGGPGMVMGVYPLRTTIQAAKAAQKGPSKVIYVSPQGRTLNQSAIQEMALEERLIFIAGRYEGIDERLIELEIDEEWSVGDYVLSGGELAVMVMIDALTRLIPGVLGHELSAKEDSFSNGLLDCPHYTRPEEVDGLKVPEVLLSGDHASIHRWRLKQSLGRTWLRRPELIEKLDLTIDNQALLQEFIKEHMS